MSKKILIVDDDIDLIEMYAPVLQKEGFEVASANDSVEGFQQFEAFEPDVAFVDLSMEHFDSGFGLCRKIKSTDAGRHTQVFILTSAAHDTGFRFSTQTGEEKNWIKADGYLDKPISAVDLVQFLKEKVLKNV